MDGHLLDGGNVMWEQDSPNMYIFMWFRSRERAETKAAAASKNLNQSCRRMKKQSSAWPEAGWLAGSLVGLEMNVGRSDNILVGDRRRANWMVVLVNAHSHSRRSSSRPLGAAAFGALHFSHPCAYVCTQRANNKSGPDSGGGSRKRNINTHNLQNAKLQWICSVANKPFKN